MSDIPNPVNVSGQPPATLVNAIRKLLRPLVRLMLTFQITYPFVINLLKAIYVEVAEEEFKVAGKRPSDSRINLLTGVHRKDVKRLRTETDDELRMPRNMPMLLNSITMLPCTSTAMMPPSPPNFFSLTCMISWAACSREQPVYCIIAQIS